MASKGIDWWPSAGDASNLKDVLYGTLLNVREAKNAGGGEGRDAALEVFDTFF